MGRVVAVEAGDTGEQVLIALAREQVSVVEHGAAEIGQQPVARTVHPHLVPPLHLNSIVEHGEISRSRDGQGRLARIWIKHAATYSGPTVASNYIWITRQQPVSLGGPV